jgi:hypothetical protein
VIKILVLCGGVGLVVQQHHGKAVANRTCLGTQLLQIPPGPLSGLVADGDGVPALFPNGLQAEDLLKGAGRLGGRPGFGVAPVLVPGERQHSVVPISFDGIAPQHQGTPAQTSKHRVLADQRSHVHLPVRMLLAQMGQHDSQLDRIPQPMAELDEHALATHRRCGR